ncbi:Quinol monooxygenase YgiN [Flavobacterium succinicans]|jgi:autoinducer 2-degrading protein|uniref:Quinol monooxygenase YgiN n=1 Tax=Flavobacterium succinicans TaxID=29536 RepID=A0A1I4WR61_9FLAO|nr:MULTISPECIES: antibiotic biosynthesis monooxygenase family protein [Flavobacterium]OOV25923.1 antibiotic biosynthesis monooxygenase [Flavobacterium sp. LM5]SFN16045.1 Quinol monooxygenase YgiN [Flavobacterium succinicans]
MLVRIVKLSFLPEHITTFLENFESIKHQIRNTPGNCLLELYQDQANPNIFFTYSYWETASDLENYRQSAFFNDVWTDTKKLFNAKPEAWSVHKLESLV